MLAFYSDTFVLPLPSKHTFPMTKYRRLREQVIAEGIVGTEDLRLPEAATDDQILRAHDAEYLRRVIAGELTPLEQRRIGFPWSPDMVERSRRSSGGTIGAGRAALTDGVAVNLAGGTHHAFRDHGEGYCVFNDSAIAARALQDEKRIRCAVILDCDVHQGNGTAAILAGDSSIFTFSVHGAKNFPLYKEVSDLDVELPDGTTDADYLIAVEEGARRAIAVSGADIAIYLAGADPFWDDRYGRMKVSKAGLAERDRIIFSLCQAAGLPVVVTMAGGYARNVEDIVDIHVQTVRTAAQFAHMSL